MALWWVMGNFIYLLIFFLCKKPWTSFGTKFSSAKSMYNHKMFPHETIDAIFCRFISMGFLVDTGVLYYYDEINISTSNFLHKETILITLSLHDAERISRNMPTRTIKIIYLLSNIFRDEIFTQWKTAKIFNDKNSLFPTKHLCRLMVFLVPSINKNFMTTVFKLNKL